MAYVLIHVMDAGNK